VPRPARTPAAKAKRGADTRHKMLVGALVPLKLDDPDFGTRFRAFLGPEDNRALFQGTAGAQDRPADPEHPDINRGSWSTLMLQIRKEQMEVLEREAVARYVRGAMQQLRLKYSDR